MSKDQWIADHERAQEDFATWEIDEPEFRERLRELGFRQGPEIQAEIDCLIEDRLCNELDEDIAADLKHTKDGVYA